MACFTEAQVREHNNSSSCWISYKGRVYDITDFLQDHPGGLDILLGFAGTDVTHVLGDENLHIHSDAAYELLDEYYYVGDLEACPTPELLSGSVSSSSPSVNGLSDQDDDLTPLNTTKKDTDRILCDHVSNATDNNHEKFLDLRKPLFSQLWNATWSKAFYLEQVHRPRFVPYYVPYFSNSWMDVLSRTTWYTVPMIWIPFVCYQLWKSFHTQDSSMAMTFNTFCSGVLAWTLLEYALHRFLFHLDDWLPDRPLALLFHFTLHGIHHHMPMDRYGKNGNWNNGILTLLVLDFDWSCLLHLQLSLGIPSLC